MSGQKPRAIAVRLLQRRPGGPFIEHLLETALARTRLLPADRHLCQELVYGIVRWQATLDWLIARKTQNRTQHPLLQNLLRLGLYQVFWLDRIPNHAAVYETVELARRNGLGPQAAFVNALLRGYLRQFDATRQLLAQLKVTQPHLGYSHPDWLAARWRNRWGADRAAQLMEWNNTTPGTFARLNTLKADPAMLLARWRQEDVQYEPVCRDWVEENRVFELKSHPPLARLPSFQQGLFYVQDPSTLLAPQELAPQPGETVLDLCAAPGGKLSCLAQLMRNQGRLVAHDTAPERLKLIRENCARLGITCVTLEPRPATLGAFDRILVDAPCSDTGVLRRRVDLRWRIRPEAIARQRTAQLALLRQAAPLLRPGGQLVYSTCSLEPEENQEVVRQFLEGHPGLKLERQRELLPFADHVDGAYVARIN
ncbi:MAG: 16S rRNA (cytosine(967)-C(5))-methyltransferase RsmB [Verrucomicrobiota bacterium]